MATFKVMVSILVWGWLLAGSAGAMNIDIVLVGDPGNEPDSRYAGYGAVGYSFGIGKYEVTAGQYAAFLNKVGGVDLHGLFNPNMSSVEQGCGITRSGEGTVDNPYTYVVASEFVNRPVNYVSYWDACRFANWMHNGQPAGAQGVGTTETGAYTLTADGIDYNAVARNADWSWALANENEWYKAAYYKGGSTNAGYFDYTTGNDTTPGRDVGDASGNNANFYTGIGLYPIDSSKYTTIGGEFQNSASPYGTFDQGGNVWEWNEGVYNSSYRGLWGGAYSNDVSYLHAASSGNSNYPAYESANMGFRVVAVPEPATIALLALVSVGIIRRRKA